MPTVDKEEGSTMVISPPQKRSRMKFLKIYQKMYFCDILVIYVDTFSDYVKNRLHPEGLIWSVQTIRVVHSRPMFWGLKWVPYSPSLVGGKVFIYVFVLYDTAILYPCLARPLVISVSRFAAPAISVSKQHPR